ncbi:MAG: helix-turn-helix transcriptional regulator, partial [Chloroflexota bacterium]|nr:helix-turn-helix transcriptional regulator [Chloroflexota bacterium]
LAALFKRARPIDPAAVFDQLTPREREIAALAAQGYTNQEIADELVIARDTVKTHMRSILTKLGLHSKAELRLYWANRDWSASE